MMRRVRPELVILAMLVIPAFIILSSTPMRLFSLVTIDPVAFVFSAAFFVAIGWFVRLRS